MTVLESSVIVVGGGPAGASTAFYLARAGVPTLVLDRARFPRDKACAEYLSPQASRILDEMGALPLVERAGAAQLTGMMVRAPSGVTIRGEFAGAHGFRGFRDRGLALRRTVLDAILLDRARAAGAVIEEGVRVTDVLRAGDGRVVGVRTVEHDGAVRERRARIVVGADGLRSVIARRLGLARTARWPSRLALVTHYRGVAGIGSFGEMHVDTDGYFGVADVGGGEANVAVVIPGSHARSLGGDPGAFVGRWIAARPELAARFAAAYRTTDVKATGPFASAATRGWAPGAALVGDAADFFDPFTGEGMYAALRGGELLLPYVFDAVRAPSTRAADIALDAYDRCRRLEFGGKWRVERIVGMAVAFPPLINHAARSLSRRRDMADLLVGVTGDFVPPREVFRPSYVLRLLLGGFRPSARKPSTHGGSPLSAVASADTRHHPPAPPCPRPVTLPNAHRR